MNKYTKNQTEANLSLSRCVEVDIYELQRDISIII